jgi:hypothetical protein
MAGQHWGERGNPGEPVCFSDRLVEWVCVGISRLACIGHFLVRRCYLTWPLRQVRTSGRTDSDPGGSVANYAVRRNFFIASEGVYTPLARR